MSKTKIALVAYEQEPIPDWVNKSLTEAGMEFVHHECETQEELLHYAADADIVWVVSGSKIVSADVLDKLTKCGAIIRTGTGTDNVPVAEATKRGIIVANTPEAAGRAVAEHTVALLVSTVRIIPIQDRHVHQGIWDRHVGFPKWHLWGQTAGFIGYGYIARYAARMLRGFEMKIMACDPNLTADEIARHAGAQKAEMDEVLKQSDFIFIHTPLLDGTYHMINEEKLRKMKPTSILINTSRGPVVDEKALIRALRGGWISAAGLDVTEQEPIEKDNPLLKMDNVVITPHIAGYNDEFLYNFWKHSVDTAIDLANHRWPRHFVNEGVKPRWSIGD